jgi:hypothetical protein
MGLAGTSWLVNGYNNNSGIFNSSDEQEIRFLLIF